MDDEHTNASWTRAIETYDSLVEQGWHHISAFRELVAEISKCAEASGLTAVTSHETLIVSPYTCYPDWFDGRHIRLHPLANGSVRLDKVPQRFELKPTETWTVLMPQALERARSLLSSL